MADNEHGTREAKADAKGLTVGKAGQGEHPIEREERHGLIRSWGGEGHKVSVSGNGYEYRGKQFKSLSEIAREITGTRCSGPLFFGTKKKAA